MLPRESVLLAVCHASQRRAVTVHEDLSQGINSLAAITTLAPFFGFLGTVIGIVTSFKGIVGEATAHYVAINKYLSEALWPAAMGLLIGIIALWFHRVLSSNLRSLDLEMGLAAHRLPNQLAQVTIPSSTFVDDRPMFGAQTLADLDRDQRFFRVCLRLSVIASISAWILQGACLRYVDAYSPYSAVRWSAVDILFMTLMCCFPAYPIWVKFLHRRRGGLLALSSFLGLCWTVIMIANHL